MSAVVFGPWVIGQRYVSKKFSAYRIGTGINGETIRSQILGPDGEDALFDSEAEAMAAVEIFCEAEGLPRQRWRARWSAQEKKAAQEEAARAIRRAESAARAIARADARGAERPRLAALYLPAAP